MSQWQKSGLSGKFIFATVLGMVASVLAGCDFRPDGADFDEALQRKEDGLVYRIGEDKPYTGKAYKTPSPEMLPMINWQGEFKNGRPHGIFVFPTSRVAHDVFESGDERAIRVEFKDGIELGNQDQPQAPPGWFQ